MERQRGFFHKKRVPSQEFTENLPRNGESHVASGVKL